MKAGLRWAAIIGGALVALVLLAAGTLAFLVSRLDVRAEVERAVENATGRDLAIAGDVGVSYWPVLGLHAGEARLANVEGGRASAFIAADDIHIGVELRPLLDRQVVVRRLVLRRPSIALEVDAQGKPNWILAPRARPGAPPAQTRPNAPAIDVRRTSLREVSIDGGEVSFFDARRGVGWVIGDVKLKTALTSLGEPMRAEGDIRYNDRAIALAIDIANPGAAMRGAPSSVKLLAESELLNARFEGQTTAASGEVAGAIEASGPSLRQLAAWTGAPLQGGVGLENFSVTGRIAIGGGAYDFSNAAFTLDRLRGRGDFVFSQHAGKPYVSGRLEVFDFDLNPYLTGQAPPPAEAEGAPSASDAPTPTAEIAAIAPPPRAVDVAVAPSETPIDFSGLQALNADLELTTHAFLVQHMRVDAARLNLVLNNGYLAATLHNLTLYGGSGRGRFEVDARGPGGPIIVQDLAFSHLDARAFLSDAINFSNIEGRAEIALNVRAQGRTQSELVNAADGRAHIEVISGALHGVDLGGVARTIRNALRGELIAPEAVTRFHGFSATFAIADGVLASDDLSFNTPDLRIPGIGVIDVAARRMDMRLSPRSPQGGIAIPFSVRGPWAQFSYASDLNGRTQREILPRVRQVEAAALAR